MSRRRETVGPVSEPAGAPQQIPITASLQSHESSDGKNAHFRYRRGVARIAPPCLACSQSFFTCRQKIRPNRKRRKITPATMEIVTSGWSEMFPRLTSNDPGTERNR